ncbi:MAG: hypothetical protein ACXAC7_24545 [Candidatus Hodarchaeales archaeon]|jgi:hypothetical protein
MQELATIEIDCMKNKILFLDDFVLPEMQEFATIEIDFMLNKVGSLINFLQGRPVIASDIAMLKKAFPITDSEIIPGGAQTLFVWKIPFDNQLFSRIIIKPYITAMIETLIHHTASVHYWKKTRQKKFTMKDQIIYINPMAVLGIAVHEFHLGRTFRSFPILLQAESPSKHKTVSITIDRVRLSAILKALAKLGFTFDGHLFNWRVNPIPESNAIELDYLDLLYYNKISEIQKDINKILIKFR